MRYVHVIWDGAGNVPPQAAMIERLTTAGHEVVSVASPSIHDQLRAAGATCVDASAEPRPVGLAGPEEMMDTFGRYCFGRSWSDDLLAAVEAHEPDRLLVDGMLFAAMAGAEATGLPTAVLWHSLFTTLIESPFAELFQTHFAENLQALRSELDLASLDHVIDQLRAPDWVIAFTYPSIDRPPSSPWPNLHYAGAAVGGAEDVDVVLPDGDEPLVVVGFSTSDMGQRPVLQNVVDGLAGLGVRTLVTTGPAVDPSTLDLGPHAIAVDYLPHDTVLPRAALLVSHVGHGTLAAGVRHGVPILAMPMGRDQTANAMVVEHLGVGRSAAADASPDDIAVAARAVLDDDQVRTRAADLADRVAQEARLDDAVALVTGS